MFKILKGNIIHSAYFKIVIHVHFKHVKWKTWGNLSKHKIGYIGN